MVASAFGLEPAWVAAAGALVLAGPGAGAGGRSTPVARAAGDAIRCSWCSSRRSGWWCDAAIGHGLQDALAARAAQRHGRCSPLLALAVIAAVLANLINNLPATLVLLAALGAPPAAGAVLAVLIGVNIGPNLTYAGSLATLLWRRCCTPGRPPSLGEFTLLGLLTVPAALLAAVVALWVGHRLF